MVTYDEDKGLAVVTRSRKEVRGGVTGNKEEHTRNKGKDIEEEEIIIPHGITKKPQSEEEKHKPCLKSKKPLPKISLPFPQRLKKMNEDEKFKKFQSVFKTLSINLPLVEALL
ncbi:hypothetical protein KY285_026501 [Solanum tuberosum]|nr:hypothetical protein KY285_026501 [Solanum tuberosum]